MCGFVGVLHGKGRGPVNAETLRALLPWIRHRGPDQEGVFVKDGFGVAAARLAIRGGAEGDQPLVSDDGNLVVVFNGELSGWAANTPDASAFFDDIEVRARVDVLRGSMGAWVRFDKRDECVVLGSDPVGIKPLFTYRSEAGLWFASEMKPIFAAVPESRACSIAGLSQLLHFQRATGRLPFDRISRHRSGCETFGSQVLGETVHSSSSWRLDPSEPEDPVAATRHAVETSARQAADVDGPVSLFLSGGLDSSAVAALCGRADVLCLTGRFEPHGGDLDESGFAADVASHLGLQHEVVDLRDEDLLLDLPDVITALEVPMMGPGSLALWRMAKRAREHGKVVLTGTGGDELFGGYARTALALGRAGPWTKGYEPLRARIEAAGEDPRARLQACFSRFADLEPCLDRAFLRSLPEPEPVDLPAGDTLFEALLREEREGTLRGLLDVEDRVTSAHGLEGRPVLCLGAVPHVAHTMPDDWLIGPDGEGKRVLREALRGHIPEHVRTNKVKRGFPTPFVRAARGAGREIAMEILHDRRFVERGWWNVAACRALLDADRPLHDRALWAVLSWETWARLFLDGDLFKDPPAA